MGGENSMHHLEREVTGGVDTHSEQHVAAVVDEAGRILGTEAFPATGKGYRQLLSWMGSYGCLVKVGVEGTGSYGAGLARYFSDESVTVVEVNRPNRQARRRRGKSDTTDAEAAARAALNGEATGTPKSADGPAEALRALRVARRSAVKARTQAANQLRDLMVTAPEELRVKMRGLRTQERVAICARLRPGSYLEPNEATKAAMRCLARRHQELTVEIEDLDAVIAPLCHHANPALLSALGVGPEVASALLVAAGDNPDRMHSEGSFASLCGSSPVEASSGKVTRHRLNRGGNREANNALWRIVMVRLACDNRTQIYADRRRAEGKSKKEVLRCLKRYVAREVYYLLVSPPVITDVAELRERRVANGITLATVAAQLGTWASRVSALERGLTHNQDLAHRYRDWLDDRARLSA
jgi:transposase